MTHTHHPGIVARWKLRINRRHYIEVFIWQDKPSMYDADDYNHENTKNADTWIGRTPRNFLAQAHHGHYAINPNGKVKLPRKFGEIFFVRDGYGARVVAHEIAHIINYWIGANRLDFYNKDDEHIAKITGELHRQFWNNHYRVFK